MLRWLFKGRRRRNGSVFATRGSVAIGGNAVNSPVNFGLDEAGVVNALLMEQLRGTIAHLYAEKARLERALEDHAPSNARHPDPLLDIYGPEFFANIKRINDVGREFELANILLKLCDFLKILGGADRLKELIGNAEQVLRIYSREEAPYQWATAKMHIGCAEAAIALGKEEDEINVALFEKAEVSVADAVDCFDPEIWRDRFVEASVTLGVMRDQLAALDSQKYPAEAAIAVYERARAVCPASSQYLEMIEERLAQRD